jgi:hypothetical protein
LSIPAVKKKTLGRENKLQDICGSLQGNLEICDRNTRGFYQFGKNTLKKSLSYSYG